MHMDSLLFLLTAALPLLYLVRHWAWAPSATRAHTRLRQEWFTAIAQHKGTEVLGVQTLRNSLMSCTMTATTATLAFMGGLTLTQGHWPSQWWHHGFPPLGTDQGLAFWNAFAVLVLLALAFLTSMLAARNYHHAGFVAGMPVESAARRSWQTLGERSLMRAGLYYSQSLRLMIWAVPLALFYIHSLLGAAVGVALFVSMWGWLDVDR
ncbi:MAG: DUF599 domain-containing protein [Acidovorax sp.]|nr:MAG: DUF599 domain-containing protein [Acidovorax sp.]